MDSRWLSALLLIACPVWAGPFKCRQPDGSIAYQQIPCANPSAGTELELDTRPPSGDEAREEDTDYSVEGQLKALEAERKKALKGQKKGATPRQAASDRDRAKCAKHRAEAARWRRATKHTYRDLDDKEHKEQMLEHHQALVERYCGD